MKIKNLNKGILGDERGAIAVITALLVLFVLVGVAALAVDIGRVATVKNELQNAADAGALAGAAALYTGSGSEVNTEANKIAFDTAIENLSMNEEILINWVEGTNSGDIQRGHWSFNSRTFTPNDSIDPIDLWGVSDYFLDNYVDFINAVRVITRKEVSAFFSPGFSREVVAEAIAYIGFVGQLNPMDVDQPFTICDTAIQDSSGNYNCDYARFMIPATNSQHLQGTSNWTDFSQPCSGSPGASSVNNLVCSTGNPNPLIYGQGMTLSQQATAQSVGMSIRDCWNNYLTQNGDVFWRITIPVVECPLMDTNCGNLIGAVTVDVIWITGTGNDPHFNDAPYQMDDWSSNDPDGSIRWLSFVNHFNINDPNILNPTPADLENYYQPKTLYFKPSCQFHEPVGRTGGQNFGMLSRIPALVK